MKFFKTAWKNIRRSPYQAFAAVFIMTLTFLAFSLFAIIFYGSSEVVNYFESKPQVTAFFKDEAKQEEIDELKKSLNDSTIVSSVKFVTKEEALEIYKNQNKDDPLLLDLVTADILPASLEISTFLIDDLTLVSDTLQKSAIVEEVVFQKDVVSTLTSWTNAIRKVGVFIVTLLAVVSVFIMVIIVGIKVSQKRGDIETMRLIGAGNWYVRMPFIIEGIAYGMIGAIIGWIISYGLLLYATPQLSYFLKGVPVFPLSPTFMLSLLGVEVLFAVLLGTFSSYFAVLRYLKK
jgi:cell division transport system permease protein